MSAITTKDGTQIYYNDWGKGWDRRLSLNPKTGGTPVPPVCRPTSLPFETPWKKQVGQGRWDRRLACALRPCF
jgi:hypothetical protein